MADYAISLSETISVFGLAPSNKWGTLVWGEGNWGGDDGDVIQYVTKYLAETQTIDEAVSKGPSKYLAETQTIEAEQSDTKLRDGDGYAYVFPGPTTDAEEQVITDWTEGTASSTWTSGTVGSTEWT